MARAEPPADWPEAAREAAEGPEPPPPWKQRGLNGRLYYANAADPRLYVHQNPRHPWMGVTLNFGHRRAWRVLGLLLASTLPLYFCMILAGLLLLPRSPFWYHAAGGGATLLYVALLCAWFFPAARRDLRAHGECRGTMPQAHDPGAFLGLEGAACGAAAARVRVLPVPYEATVSYGGGAARGPAAILEASRQVELYDRACGREPALDYGVHTLPAVAFAESECPEQALGRVRRAAAQAWEPGRLLLSLGGEHSVTAGLFAGVAEKLGGPMAVVHLDAHADLRLEYGGTPHSHACALRRVVENPACERLVQLGIRSLSADEAEWIKNPSKPSETWFAEQMRENGGGAWAGALARAVRGRTVYFTLDVDAVDPSEMPGTGTPEPDGLRWRQVLEAARVVAREAACVAAFDLVETAPVPGSQVTEFAAAKLAYGLASLFAPP